MNGGLWLLPETSGREETSNATGFAFILSGCQEAGATLVITDTDIDAELPEDGDEVLCEIAVNYLATFEVSDDALPEGAELAD